MNDDTLPMEIVSLVDDACDRFENEWKKDQSPRIETFLAEVSEQAQQPLLQELILLEFALRRKRGDKPTIEDYQDRFADHAELVAGIFPDIQQNDSVTQCLGADQDQLDHLQMREKAGECPEIPGYRILSEVHRGGQGIVYKAIQLSTKREVAFKVLHSGQHASRNERLRFEREAELMANLGHPTDRAMG